MSIELVNLPSLYRFFANLSRKYSRVEKIKLLFLSVLSGLMLWASWPVSPFSPGNLLKPPLPAPLINFHSLCRIDSKPRDETVIVPSRIDFSRRSPSIAGKILKLSSPASSESFVPDNAAKVAMKSVKEIVSWLSVPGLILPGQRAMNGSR